MKLQRRALLKSLLTAAAVLAVPRWLFAARPDSVFDAENIDAVMGDLFDGPVTESDQITLGIVAPDVELVVRPPDNDNFITIRCESRFAVISRHTGNLLRSTTAVAAQPPDVTAVCSPAYISDPAPVGRPAWLADVGTRTGKLLRCRAVLKIHYVEFTEGGKNSLTRVR